MTLAGMYRLPASQLEIHRRHPWKWTTLAKNRRTHIGRKLIDALFQYRNRRGSCPVVLGKPGDDTLLGMVTLEALETVLDPLRRALKPLPMLLAYDISRYRSYLLENRDITLRVLCG